MNSLRLSLPGSIDTNSVVSVLRRLLAVASPPQRPGFTSSVICLEVWAGEGQIGHLVTTPRDRQVIDTLTAVAPGIRIETTDRPVEGLAGVGVGVRFSGPVPGMLRTDLTSEVSMSLLSAMTGVRSGETVVVQWLIAPLVRTRSILQPAVEIDKLTEKKRADTEVVAIGRVAAWSSHRLRSLELVADIARVVRSNSGPSGSIQIRRDRRVPRQVIGMRPPVLVWPSHLNVAELAPLIGWPTDNTPIQGLSRGATRLLPLPASAPMTGPTVGVTTYPGQASEIRLGDIGRLRHLHVMGPTGVGKSTLLTRLITQDIREGRGVVVFDPLGDLTREVCARVPASRLDDVIVVDPTDTERPVGMNALRGANRYQTTDFVVGVMSSLFTGSWGPRTEDILRASVLTLTVTPDSTLVDIPELLTNPGVRRRLIAPVMSDRSLAQFWTWYDQISDAERSSVIAPLLNKLRAIALRPEATRTLAHPDGQLDLLDVFTKRRIIIVRLAKGLIGEQTAQLIGGILLAKLWQTILGRAHVAPERRHRVFVYLDEFQDYLRLPIGIGDMLAQARGLGVGLVVAHQHLGQLPDRVQSDVLSNVGSRIVFQTNVKDARVIARDLEPHLTASDLQSLGSREIVARIATPDRMLPPVTGRTQPAGPPLNDPNIVIAHSRERYGRPVPDQGVEMETEKPVGRRRRPGGPS